MLIISLTRKETSYSVRRFWVSYILFIIVIGGILVLFIYTTRLASNEIFSPSNKIHREVGRAKDLSAPLYQNVHWDIAKDLCYFFTDWRQEFVRVNWAKWMHALNNNGIDWGERSVKELYIDQRVKIWLDQGDKRIVKNGMRDEGAVCEWFHSNYVYSEYLLKEALGGFGDFRIGGQVIRTEICRWPCATS